MIFGLRLPKVAELEFWNAILATRRELLFCVHSRTFQEKAGRPAHVGDVLAGEAHVGYAPVGEMGIGEKRDLPLRIPVAV